MAIINAENPIKPSATQNFETEVGSLSFSASLPQNIDIKGAIVMMNNGFNDWNQPVGIMCPKNSLCVEFSANNVKEHPACS